MNLLISFYFQNTFCVEEVYGSNQMWGKKSIIQGIREHMIDLLFITFYGDDINHILYWQRTYTSGCPEAKYLAVLFLLWCSTVTSNIVIHQESWEWCVVGSGQGWVWNRQIRKYINAFFFIFIGADYSCLECSSGIIFAVVVNCHAVYVCMDSETGSKIVMQSWHKLAVEWLKLEVLVLYYI